MTKKGLHPRNPHNEQYDFSALTKSLPELSPYVSKNQFDNLSIDFSNPKAVILLNKALLAHFYEVKIWDIPKGHLCPPIPGRADYIHYIADLLSESNDGVIPTGRKIKGLDIGTGTGCIYPIIGNSVYGWKFVGTDISQTSVDSSKKIISANPALKKNIKCRLQKSPKNIFIDIMQSDEHFDFTMCNPPFHSSLQEAREGSDRKQHNLKKNTLKKGITKKENKKSELNFGGQNEELWCPGGEVAFIKRMITQSVKVKTQCHWFTTLVSKKDNLPEIYKALEKIKPADMRTIEMHQGQKITRIIAWKFE